MTTNVALYIAGLTKAFGANTVLRGIELELLAGQVTVLMGANGAGKSTLVKIIGGVHREDAGTMLLDGQPYRPADPADAIRAGIVTVHQSINDGVIPDLDVATNLVLDRLPGRGEPLFYRPKRARAVAAEVQEVMGLHLDLKATVGDLPLAERQMVAIARALARNPRVLILDEPTSSLSEAEASRLFGVVERLKASGVAVLYISHRMSDIRRLADRISCLRDGAISGRFEDQPLDYEGAMNAMLGHGLTNTGIDIRPPGAPVLVASGVRLLPQSDPFDLSLHKGEVVALTGLVGMGKTAFAETLVGARRAAAGTLILGGEPFAPRNIREAIAAGVFYSAKDRANNAVVPMFSIFQTISLPFLDRYQAMGLLFGGPERAMAKEQIQNLGIVCQTEQDMITTLSGGNQQKSMVARWLSQPSRVLILDEPFQGVDIQARRDIGAKLRETADERATLFLCAELDEALEVADRILVMSDHTLVGEHPNRDVDLDLILAQIASHSPQNAA